MDGCTGLGLILVAGSGGLCFVGLVGYLAMCHEHRKLKATVKAMLDGQEAFWEDFNARLVALRGAAGEDTSDEHVKE